MQTGKLVFYEDAGRILSGMIMDIDGVELQVHSTRQANIKEHRFMPLYRTTKGKVVYRNAIDTALKNNQIGAVSRIIWYIVRYQNNFVSSFLFLRNFPKFLEKGIEISDLLESYVFKYDFDYDDWP